MSVKIRKGGAWVNMSASVDGTTRVARIYDSKTMNTGAGAPSGTGFEDRTLNTKDDPFGFVSLDSGNVYFSLPAGTYKIDWRVPSNDGGLVRSKLVYADNTSFTSSLSVLGESGCGDTTSVESNYYTTGSTILSINEVTYFKIQQAQQYISDGNWGNASNLGGAEIYTQVFVEDLTTAVKDNEYSGISKIATVKDVKAYNVQGGSFTGNTWIVRDLNTLHDPQSIGFSVNTNIVTFPAGTYKIKWRVPAYHCNRHTSRLAYSTNSTVNADNQLTTGVTYTTGETSYSNADGNVYSYSEGIISSLTLTSTTYFQIQHFSDDGYTHTDATGLGVASNLADTEPGVGGIAIDSLYSTLEIEDLKTAVKEPPAGDVDFVAGMIMMYSGASAPTGWAFCDGNDGRPDLRDKFIIGGHTYDGGAWKTNVTGSLTQSGGSKDAVVVQHNHDIGNWGGSFGGSSGATVFRSDTTGTNTDSIQNAGEDGTNKNLPPYYALAYIIKT